MKAFVVYLIAIAAMITTAFGGTRTPSRFQCLMRHYRNTQLKQGLSIGLEQVGFWLKQTRIRGWSTA
jgi:hypothetical protein